jgi:hypothetical protein
MDKVVYVDPGAICNVNRPHRQRGYRADDNKLQKPRPVDMKGPVEDFAQVHGS